MKFSTSILSRTYEVCRKAYTRYTKIVNLSYYSNSKYSSILNCHTNSSICETMIIVPSYSSRALAMTGRCRKLIWFVGSSRMRRPGFSSASFANMTSHFCHSESAPIGVAMSSPVMRNPEANDLRSLSRAVRPDASKRQS